MSPDPEMEQQQLAAARREAKASLLMLMGLLVVLALATRGFFSFIWYFPLVFAVIIALSAMKSLLTARKQWWQLRSALALIILAVCALLPRLHVQGVEAKVEAYERRGSETLVGTVGLPIPYVVAQNNGGGKDGSGKDRAFELGGRISLLNFWATWCAPCIEEIPLLQQFWNENRSRGIEVVGVTKPRGGGDAAAEASEIEAFLAVRGATYPSLVVSQSSPTHAAYRVRSLPTSILVGADGVIVGFAAGRRGTLRLMEQARAMAAPSP